MRPDELDPDSVDITSEEFSDYSGPVVPEGASFDLSQLLTAESLRGIAAIVVSILVIRTPSTQPRTFAIMLAVILLAWAVGGLADLRDRSRRSFWSISRVALLIAGGLGLILVPGFTGQRLAELVGWGLIAVGLLTTFRAFRESRAGERIEPLLVAAFYVAVGVALVVSPQSILGIAVLALAAYWFIAGVMTVVVNVRLDDRQIEPSSTWRMFLDWVQGQPNTADDRSQLYEKLFFEGGEGPRRLSRFFTLMGFATAIAFWGVVADSTAVVIGAMLVAPLMSPLMGTSLSMVMGWPRRALMSGGVAVGGVLFAIGLSVLFGWMYGPDVSTITNTQVASRIGPTLVDLLIAVAAGGAGAFALSRPDVSDSLPGVAVAIALVPPLAVVGLMISQGNWGAASGGMLLFLTNLVAIILFGGLVFVLTGVVPILQLLHNSRWIGRSLGMVGLAAIAVVALLGLNLQSFQRQSAGLETAERVVMDWLEGTDLVLNEAAYGDGIYKLVVSGPDEPPIVDELAASVEAEFGEPIAISVTWVPTETFDFTP
jgi:uncharacterized hydrophobic protein (TIGR00271 family)